jgi:hypothetical protein
MVSSQRHGAGRAMALQIPDHWKTRKAPPGVVTLWTRALSDQTEAEAMTTAKN